MYSNILHEPLNPSNRFNRRVYKLGCKAMELNKNHLHLVGAKQQTEAPKFNSRHFQMIKDPEQQ